MAKLRQILATIKLSKFGKPSTQVGGYSILEGFHHSGQTLRRDKNGGVATLLRHCIGDLEPLKIHHRCRMGTGFVILIKVETIDYKGN